MFPSLKRGSLQSYVKFSLSMVPAFLFLDAKLPKFIYRNLFCFNDYLVFLKQISFFPKT